MSTQSEKPNRRWLRFSLRTILILLTVGCIWLGLTVHRVTKQRKVVRWVTELGGIAIYDYEQENPFIDKKTPAPEWLCNLIGIDFFATVVEVHLQSINSVSDVTPLANLTNLKELDLRSTQVSDITPLSNLTKLENVYLGHTHVHDVKPLANLTNLKRLDLQGTLVSDVAPLSKLRSLGLLDLSHTEVSHEDCRLLQKPLPALRIYLP